MTAYRGDASANPANPANPATPANSAADALAGRVLLFATGGTIASVFDDSAGGLRPARTGSDLMAVLPPLPDIELEIIELANSSSTFFTPEQVFGWSRLVAQRLADPAVAGAVVAHGTDTMEESAYLFDLVVDTAKPLVFTGAMRPASDLLTDGPRNLECARLVAASEAARGLGAVVVMAEQVHAARDVTKVHPASVGGFVSPNTGPLGVISRDSRGDSLTVFRRPACREHVDTGRIAPEVAYVKTVLGSDSEPIDAAVSGGARGIVIEAFGGGEVTP